VLTDLRERADAFTTLFTDGMGDPEGNARLLGLARTSLAKEAVARVCQAYVKGWGGDATTDSYVAFARGQVENLDDVPGAWRLRASVRVGRRRARLVPWLFAAAVAYRVREELRSRLWRWTGL
jgi:hypothetical protein